MIFPSLAQFSSIVALVCLSACSATTQTTTKTKPITNQLGYPPGTTLYLEGYEPTPLPSSAAVFSNVARQKFDTLNQLKASIKETEVAMGEARSDSRHGAGSTDTLKSNTAIHEEGQKRRASSLDYSREDSKLVTQSYEGVSKQDLALDDDLKTIRQARMVWTVAGAAKGATIGAVLSGGLVALSGGDSNAIRNAAISGGIAGGAAGAADGRVEGGRKGAETVEKKRKARRTEAEIALEISRAQQFNEAVAKINAKLRARVSSQSSKSEMKSIKKDANKVLAQIDGQIKAMNEFLGDDSAESGHSAIAAKERTLNQLKVSIKETEEAMGAGRA
jgi:hypothetical protein